MTIVNSEEIYRKISTQIESQFPEFIRSDGPKFVSFLKAYFEYLEQSGKTGERARAILDIADIDRTLDDFVEQFRKELLVNIPANVQADKRLLAKYIKEFYRARGSEQSYQFLFRALFNEELNVYYPGDDILRASDGRWIQESVLYGTSFSKSPESFVGLRITGQSSGASGLVTNVIGVSLRGLTAYEISIEEITGSFESGELIEDTAGEYFTMLADSGSITSIRITDGGAFYEPGDVVNVTGNLSGAVGSATILSVNNQTTNQGLVFRIQDGGKGYSVSNTVLTITGGGGSGASLEVTSIANTETVSIDTDIIEPMQFVVLNTGPTFVSLGANTAAVSANLASGNVSSVLNSTTGLNFQNRTVGTINAISLVFPGKNYTASQVSVTAKEIYVGDLNLSDGTGGYKGKDAVIVANNATGAILTVQVNASGTGFTDGETVTLSKTASTVTTTSTEIRGGHTVSFTRESRYPASAIVVTSGVLSKPGRYLDNRGRLDTSMKLQDNYYYQEFSYVLRAVKQINDYRNVVKTVIHPSGTKMFGEVLLKRDLDIGTSFAVEEVLTVV